MPFSYRGPLPRLLASKRRRRSFLSFLTYHSDQSPSSSRHQLPASCSLIFAAFSSLVLAMAFEYTTFANGNGYRFVLPSLGLPDPKGEWVTIEAALTTTTNRLNAHKTLSRAKYSSRCRMLSPSAGGVTVDVEHDGALWLLPILQPDGKDDPQAFTLRVRRYPAPGTPAAAPPQNEDLLSDAAASLFPNGHKSASTSLASKATPTRGATSSEASSSHRPLSHFSSSASGSSEDESSDEDKEKMIEEMVSHLEQLATRTWYEGGQMIPTIDTHSPDRSNVTLVEALGPLSNNIRYYEKFNWSYTFDTTILHLVYIDELPEGDPIPAQLRKSYHESGEQWSVDFTKRTLYHKPALPCALRQQVWQAITSPKGLPCRISSDNLLVVDLGLAPRHNFIELPTTTASSASLPQQQQQQQLRNGPAKLKVISNPPGYACQPSGASPEASWFLNRYQLIVEQGNRTWPATDNLAKYVELNEEILYCLLAQAAATVGSPSSSSSTRSGSSRSRPTRMAYGQQPPPIQHFTTMFNVGIRLRSGGARFPVINKGPKQRHPRLLMPGTACWHALYGDYENVGIIKRHDPIKSDKTREVDLRLPVPPVGRQDILFRVQDHEEGKYEILEYAFRKQGSFDAVREKEWKRVVPGRGVEEWVVEFFLKLARESGGVRDGNESEGESEEDSEDESSE